MVIKIFFILLAVTVCLAGPPPSRRFPSLPPYLRPPLHGPPPRNRGPPRPPRPPYHPSQNSINYNPHGYSKPPPPPPSHPPSFQQPLVSSPYESSEYDESSEGEVYFPEEGQSPQNDNQELESDSEEYMDNEDPLPSYVHPNSQMKYENGGSSKNSYLPSTPVNHKPSLPDRSPTYFSHGSSVVHDIPSSSSHGGTPHKTHHGQAVSSQNVVLNSHQEPESNHLPGIDTNSYSSHGSSVVHQSYGPSSVKSQHSGSGHATSSQNNVLYSYIKPGSISFSSDDEDEYYAPSFPHQESSIIHHTPTKSYVVPSIKSQGGTSSQNNVLYSYIKPGTADFSEDDDDGPSLVHRFPTTSYEGPSEKSQTQHGQAISTQSVVIHTDPNSVVDSPKVIHQSPVPTYEIGNQQVTFQNVAHTPISHVKEIPPSFFNPHNIHKFQTPNVMKPSQGTSSSSSYFKLSSSKNRQKPSGEEQLHDREPSEYQYDYQVNDQNTGDHKSHSEIRDGNYVKGKYTVLQPDGKIRTVSYEADKQSGFNAEVNYSH